MGNKLAMKLCKYQFYNKEKQRICMIMILMITRTILVNQPALILTLTLPVNERTEMKLETYLSEACMCSEFGFSGQMSVTKGLTLLLDLYHLFNFLEAKTSHF